MALVLGLCLLLGGRGFAQPRDHAAFYIDTYHEVPATDDPRAATAHRIFERVRAAADKSRKHPRPRLVVVGPEAAPWALALPDGTVVISQRALDICFEGTDPQGAEARSSAGSP